MKRIFSILICLVSVISYSQEKGSIAGKITDKETGDQPLPFANVTIKNTSKGTTSDFDGLYEINTIDPGTYTVVFSFVGYETLEVPNVKVVANKVTEVNTGLGASAAALDEVMITTVARRDSETALLLDQKDALEIKTAIGAQELARKGVSNAEGALTKISGVSKQEGEKNVFVRGLGDRYNFTTLNGLPLPSDDPEYKNIALDFFSSDIINSVGVNKTFNASNYGDVAGALINITSKELYKKSILQIGLETGFNSRAVNQNFKLPQGASWFGTDMKKGVTPINSLENYNFSNSYNPDQSQNNPINSGISLQAGGKLDFENGNTLKGLLIGSVANNYVYQEGNTKQINAQGLPLRDLDFKKYYYNVSQILMGNISYGHQYGSISYNSLFLHNNSQNLGEYDGQSANISEEVGDSAYILRQQINDNVTFVNQILSNFKVNDRFEVNLDLAYNTTRSDEPDRRQNTFVNDGTNYRTAVGTPAYNHRFFSKLKDDEIAGNLKFDYQFGGESADESKGVLSFGANYRKNERRFDFIQFNHDFGSPINIDLSNIDGVFNQQNLDDNVFRLVTNNGFGADFNPLAPFFYEGDKTIYAGFASASYNFTENFSGSLGLRYENLDQWVNWNTNLSSSAFSRNVDPAQLKENYFLPSFNLKYNLSEDGILRLAGSKSYIFPQFKEVAPFVYEDVNFASFGNPELTPSDVYNIDVKYEYYFSSSEVVSLTGFYKEIIDPISRIEVNSAANQLSYINSGDKATIAGVELELRKNIFDIEENENNSFSQNLSFGINASYLYSHQDLKDPSTNFTNKEDKLQGASPFLLNTDLTFNYKKDNFEITPSLVLNYFSDRIYSLGVQQKGNIMETGIPTLDFVLQSKLTKSLGISIKARNLIDPDFELTQENIEGEETVINSFKKGRIFSLGINYNF